MSMTREQLLEEALADYVARYGLTQAARQALVYKEIEELSHDTREAGRGFPGKGEKE